MKRDSNVFPVTFSSATRTPSLTEHSLGSHVATTNLRSLLPFLKSLVSKQPLLALIHVIHQNGPAWNKEVMAAAQ